MTLCSKEAKLILISQMPENPRIDEKLDFLKKIFDPRYSTINRITRDNLCESMNHDKIKSLYTEHITPEKIEEMEIARLYFLNEAKKDNQKKCLNCSNVRNKDEFVIYWAQCIHCLEMTAEEANAKGEKRERLKNEGIFCSTCKKHKEKEDFKIKGDGSYSKTCTPCLGARKKKKEPETTPEA